MKEILNEYHKKEYIEDPSTFYNSTKMVLDIGPIGKIFYEIPPCVDHSFLDPSWFCPSLFSLLSIQDFIMLFNAILLEKSIIFVGK